MIGLAGTAARPRALAPRTLAWVWALGCVVGLVGVLSAPSQPALAQSVLDAAGAGHLVGLPIREIHFVGTRRSSAAFLREQIRSKVGDPFRTDSLDEDIRRLYMSGRVAGDIRATPTGKDGGVVLTFVVSEREVIHDLLYEGLDTVDEDDLRETPQGLRLRRGRPYEDYRARLDEHLIKEMLKAKGKFFVEIDREIRPISDGGVDVVFHVREGPTVRVEEIVFQGNDSVEVGELSRFMKTQTTVFYFIRSGYMQQAELEFDLERIKTYYRSIGFLDVRAFLQDMTFNDDRDRVTLVLRILEGDRYQVSEVAVQGATQFTAEALRAPLRTKQGAFFSGQFLEEDRGSIERRYSNKGYIFTRSRYETLVGADVPVVDLDPEAIEIARKEGNDDPDALRKPAELAGLPIADVRVVGTLAREEERFREALAEGPIAQGGAFDASDLAEEVERLRGAAPGWDDMYAATRADDDDEVIVTFRRYRAINIRFSVEEGESITIERIRVEGNTKTRDDVVRRELSLLPGDPFNADLLDESRDRLGRRGLFRDVAVSFEDGTAADRRDLVLRVEEGDTGQLLFGGGLSSSSGVFGRVVFNQRNFDIGAPPQSWNDLFNGRFFSGGAQTLTLQAEPGAQRSTYRVSFLEPYLLPTVLPLPIQLRTSFTYLDSILARSFVEQRLQGSLGLGYRISRDSLLEVSYRMTSVDVFGIDSDAPADVVDVAGKSLVSAFSLGYRISRIKIDQYQLAYGGWRFGINGELAGMGGDHDFWSVQLDGSAQMTLFKFPGTSRHVVQFRGTAGVMRPYGRSDSVPIFERFFAGGPRSLRGFEVRSVGPQEDDLPIGGLVRVTTTFEYSFPIIPGFDETYSPQWRGDFLRGVFFLDTGNVEAEIEDFTFDDFRAAVGFGFRVKIPIFPQPLALDFAFPVRQRDEDDEEMFSLTVDVPF